MEKEYEVVGLDIAERKGAPEKRSVLLSDGTGAFSVPLHSQFRPKVGDKLLLTLKVSKPKA